MSEYFVWETRRAHSHQMLVPAFASTRELGVSFIRARRFVKTIPELVIDIAAAEGRELTDDLIIRKRRCIVHSSRLMDVLLQEGVDNIDYYPCRLRDGQSERDIGTYRDADGRVRYRYQAANILDAIFCLDRDQSILEVDDEEPNEIWYVHDLRLLEDRLGDVPIFRLGERPSIVLVHERIKEAVEKAGLTGPVFLPATGYRDYPGFAFDNPKNIVGTHDLDPFGPACDIPQATVDA